jgi:hypothetical protein
MKPNSIRLASPQPRQCDQRALALGAQRLDQGAAQ